MSKVQPIMLEGHMAPVSHYAHACRAGDRLWISGMVGADADGNVPDDVVEQFKLALGAVDAVLRSQGGKPENIVKVQVFLTDINDRPKINPLRQRYFGEHRPASPWPDRICGWAELFGQIIFQHKMIVGNKRICYSSQQPAENPPVKPTNLSQGEDLAGQSPQQCRSGN